LGHVVDAFLPLKRVKPWESLGTAGGAPWTPITRLLFERRSIVQIAREFNRGPERTVEWGRLLEKYGRRGFVTDPVEGTLLEKRTNLFMLMKKGVESSRLTNAAISSYY
jgi:hypothetical protein